jgi:hypothetical protein
MTSAATMHGLYWLVANLAARQPLVLAVDDARADAPSLRWPRIEALPSRCCSPCAKGPTSCPG